MAEELKDQRIPIMMSPSEVEAIEDWMFSNRVKSRAEAIRQLVRVGLNRDIHQRALKAASELIHAFMSGEEIKEKVALYSDAITEYRKSIESEIELAFKATEWDVMNVLPTLVDKEGSFGDLTPEQQKDLASKVMAVVRSHVMPSK